MSQHNKKRQQSGDEEDMCFKRPKTDSERGIEIISRLINNLQVDINRLESQILRNPSMEADYRREINTNKKHITFLQIDVTGLQLETLQSQLEETTLHAHEHSHDSRKTHYRQ